MRVFNFSDKFTMNGAKTLYSLNSSKQVQLVSFMAANFNYQHINLEIVLHTTASPMDIGIFQNIKA